jgi:hypothetical protein
MNSMFARLVCRVLAASMIVLPYHAQAGMIGADQAPLADRGAAAARLQGFGISPQEARERVAALTDAELAVLAENIDTLPAGGISGLLPILVIIFLFWRFALSDQAKAESGKSSPKPAAKPAPAPEKK